MFRLVISKGLTTMFNLFTFKTQETKKLQANRQLKV